jgi:hypothetical protein
VVPAGPAAVVTEVGWIENLGVLTMKTACREVVIVEMLFSVLGAVRRGRGYPITLDNNVR